MILFLFGQHRWPGEGEKLEEEDGKVQRGCEWTQGGQTGNEQTGRGTRRLYRRPHGQDQGEGSNRNSPQILAKPPFISSSLQSTLMLWGVALFKALSRIRWPYIIQQVCFFHVLMKAV